MECMNGLCGSSNSMEWEKGWPLQSGGFATLCLNCGSAYKQYVFCETFHSEETGWRECTSCGKRLHCGCIASTSLLELLETGGVSCKGCIIKNSKIPSTPEEKHQACALSTENFIDQNLETMGPTQPGDGADNDGQEQCLPPSLNNALIDSSSAKRVNESLVQTNLSISLSASSNSNTFSGVFAEERQLSTAVSSFQQGCGPRHLLPRLLPNSILSAGLGLETNSSNNIPQLRVARPPVEGRVKNQLLPRYWPRITDQELKQISGDSNSTIIPLFEKVLSASDAGRIGRLVLPKACAEAYFPPISQPEGLPLRIQDVRGKEWVFQFRFWPNNNSRMYVLEGVTPCIHSMQLQAGDTVTFSRMDPEGKLLMGFRKASNNISAQKDSHYSMNNGVIQGERFFGNAENNLPVMSGYSGLLHSLKGSKNSSMPTLSKHVYAGDNLLSESSLLPERKRRNIGPKSKRLLIDGHDSLEIRISWDEVQDMLRAPPSVEPSIVSVEDHEFEEFEEPPVFAKRSIFVVRLSGEHEQWTQCDDCFKWRKMPIDILLPPKWTCQDNIDQTRCSCSAQDELCSSEIENLLKMNEGLTKRRFQTSLSKPTYENKSQDQETPTINAGGETSQPGTSSIATTTKHPRHRPGCSCIVCIQPPSGKGKHKPTCTCNVCMTVKRRFKTLMMRKKKRQSDREAEIIMAQRNNQFATSASAKDEAEVDHSTNPNINNPQVSLQFVPSDDARRSETDTLSIRNGETFKGGLDLNSCPVREITAPARVSMTSLLLEASLPLDTYLKQNGLTSLLTEQQAASSPRVENMEEHSNDLSEKDQREKDPL
ncbi:hypothetical protein ABFS83_10G004000 [Erythranthe nasuta]